MKIRALVNMVAHFYAENPDQVWFVRGTDKEYTNRTEARQMIALLLHERLFMSFNRMAQYLDLEESFLRNLVRGAERKRAGDTGPARQFAADFAKLSPKVVPPTLRENVDEDEQEKILDALKEIREPSEVARIYRITEDELRRIRQRQPLFKAMHALRNREAREALREGKRTKRRAPVLSEKAKESCRINAAKARAAWDAQRAAAAGAQRPVSDSGGPGDWAAEGLDCGWHSKCAAQRDPGRQGEGAWNEGGVS